MTSRTFGPNGEIFDVADRAAATLRSDSAKRGATFLVESVDGGDVLTAAALTEWLEVSGRVRDDDAGTQLVTR